MLSDKLKQLRRNTGMSQKALANRIGMSQQAYAKYESGITTPNPETLSLLAQIFEVSTDYLIDSPTRHNVIPVYGRVAAGIPIDAITEIEDFEEISPEMAANGQYIALKIRGNSMEPRIQNGDVVIVKLTDQIEEGKVHIVYVNGFEATCKKVRTTPDGVELISFNDMYKPMIFTKQQIAELPVRILGRVVECRSKF